MPGIDVKELIWRAYTANPADFKDRTKKIISYAENQEVGRQLFLKSRLWKDFEFNKQTKQWESRFVQEGLKAWAKFKTPAAASQYEQDAERVVEQEIRDRFFSEIKQVQEMSQREESIIHEYLQNTSKDKLLKLLKKIQDKGILSYYEHSYKKQELKLIKRRNELLEKREMLLLIYAWFEKANDKLEIKKTQDGIEIIDIRLIENEQLKKVLLDKQLEVYFRFEDSEYFGVEIPVRRLKEFLMLEEQKLVDLRQEKNRLEAEIASSKEKKSEQTESAQENLFKKNQEVQEITKHIEKLKKQIIALNGDEFTSLLEKSNEEPTLFANRDLTPKLFSMINNDAWLINSSFQGGDPAETASMFLELIHGISGNNTDLSIVELEKVIKQIQENGKQISECVRAGKSFEAIKNTSPEEMYKKFELIENDPWGKNKFSDIKERLEDTVYIEKFNDFNQLTYIAHYYDGAQWSASPKTKWTEPANRLKAPQKKIKKGSRRKIGDSDSDFDFDFDADISTEQKPIEIDIKEVISSFGIVKDLKEKNEYREKEHEQKREGERFALIKSLAINFQSQINAMSPGESFFFSGGFFKHAMLYEFKKENNGEMSLIVYNTGAGSQYHEHQTTFYQGVFKQKHFPAYTYQFSGKKTEEVAFQDYLGELLKVVVASSWEKISSDPNIKSIAKKSNEKYLYQHILPLVTHLGGRRVDPKTVVANHSFITGQRSGKCSEAVFHPMIRSKLGAKKYQRFMCAYRKETIAQFVRAQGEKGQLSHPVIQRQIRNAVSNLSKRLYKNQRVFTPYERASVAKFVAEINQKLDLALQSRVIDGLIEQPVSFKERIFEAEKFPAVQANVSNIDTEIKQDLMREKKDEPKEIAPLLTCGAQDTPQMLIEKMESVLSWAEKALSDKTTNHREIVFRIEKILMTWPLSKENLDLSVEQKNEIVENIKKIMNIYSQQSLLQFGVNLDQKLPQLLPQHVVALLSGLAIVAQTASGQEAICIKELMSTCGTSTVLQKNEFNPYLASTEMQCDGRIQELLQFFNQFTTDIPSVKDIYAKLIEEDPKQKKLLLNFYDNFIFVNPATYSIEPDALKYLSEVEKCILVLCRCKNQIKLEPGIQEIIRKFDSLVNVDNMQAVLGKMLSEKIQNDSDDLLKTLSAKDLTFVAEKTRDTYCWKFETPSSKKFTYTKVSINSNSVGKSKREISDKAIVSFFENDINYKKELFTERHIDNDAFRSSKIQVGKSGDAREVITAEEFYFKQFCHTRSSVDGQVLSTINFFQDNMKLLCDNKWQTVCECNLFQVGLLLKSLKETPSACSTIYTFLRKGLIENIENGAPNATGLFFIKMQIFLNNYLIESQSEYAKSAIENLEVLNHSLAEIIKKTKDDTLRCQLHSYQTSLIGRLVPHVADEKKTVLIQNYIKAKLSGTVGGLTADLQNPLDFMTQENICFNIAAYLNQHSDQVTFICAEKLRELGISQDVKSIFDYPNVFYPYSDSAGQHLIAINLESGQILNDGKQLLPLPKILFNNQQFVELFGDSVEQAFHCMLPGDKEPSVYEIKKDDGDYWVQKNSDGYVFQKNIISTEHGPQRYQLIPYESLGDLNRFIPKTLIDNNHRFWLSINEPKELRIEEKGSSQAVCRITDFNTDAGYIESSSFKIWTQQQTAASFLGEKFSCFESTEFIEIRELQSALYHNDAILNQPLYIIRLPRYQLTFHVMKTDPLVIHSVNPEGTLLLSEALHDLSNVKNALFLQKKSGERIALLPRQYFIADKSIEEGDPEASEYTPVRLDTQNKHQDLIVTQKNSEKKYCKQSEFLECPLDTNGKMIAKNGADALYLAYVHLANFDPESALSILQACEKSGGIKGTQKEIENLMLMFTSLPATSEQMEDVSEKMIDTPEFIAVKAYALYLYASAKYKETDREFVEPLNADGKCFYAEAKGARDKLQGYLDTFLTKYQSIKNKIPVEMQLTTQQELECLNLSNAPLLILQKSRLLAENLQKAQVTAFDPNQQKAAKIAQGRLLEGDVSEEQSQYLRKSCLFRVTPSEDKTQLLNAIGLPRTRNNTDISGGTIAACVEQYSSNKKIEMAIQQLSLNLDLKEEFFKYFLTYYHIATSKEPLLIEEKNKLKEFLACKLKILGNEHPLYGQELIIILYKILEGESLSLKSVQEFLDAVRGNSSYSYSYQVEGYVFNKDSFYAYLLAQFKDLTVTLEVEGVKEEVPLSEQKKLVELLAASSEPLTKSRDYTPPRLLSYPQGIDILEKYHLQSMRDIAKTTHSAIFLAEYKQLAFSGDAAVATIKKELNNEKEELRKAEEKLRSEKLEKKELTEGKDDVSLLSFENFASQELLYEKKIGRIKNETVQKQVELAAQYFSIKEQKEAVHKAVKHSLDNSKQCKDKLLSLIKEMVNQGSSSQESNRLHQLALQGKIRQDINEQMILNLYLLGDEKSFIDATGLTPDQVPKVYSLITEYLFVATHGQQLENIDKKLTELKNIKAKDKPFAFENIANLLAAENSIDPATDPAALSVFQFCGEALLRPEQVAYLRSHVKMTDNQFKDLMSQLIMGFGKTFLLPIIAKAKATGNNLSVIEVPDPLFDTNVTDLNNASMRFLNQKTKSLRFNRNTSCNATDLKALYDWLVDIKHNRDYLVTTGESVASINLRYVEILKSIAHQQSLIAAMGEEKVSAEREEVKVLGELTVQAHWLEKIVKLFKFEADAIIDEVHSSLNVLKKLIYSLGMEGIDQKEISAAIKLYEFALPLQVYQGYTVEEIIKNPGIVPPGKEELWKAIMEKIAEKLMSGENSPILDALTEVGNTELVKKYLLNDLDNEQIKTIEKDLFLILSASNKNLLSLYKAELTRLLPSALKKENGKHYGILLPSAFKKEDEKVQERLLAENQLLNQPCAVPFIASDTPHILNHKKGELRTTHFANPDETINYTIQAYVSKGLPDFMVRSILENLKAQAKLELIRDNKATYDLTETGKLFRELTNDKTISLDNFDKDTERLKRLVEKLQQEKPFIFYALEHHILPTIKVEQSTLEHNSNQRTYLYRTVQGIGGTTDNYRSIARMEFDQEKYMGTNGVTIDHIVRKVERTDIKIIDNSEESLVLKLLKSNTSKENLTHAIIDAGGLFTGVTNLIVAQKIADYFKSINEEKRKYILFFNEKNQFCAINVNDPNVPKDIIVIGSTEKSAIKKALNNCNEDEWFTYYDQIHTEGTDILQSSSAKASITFSYDTTLPKFSQAAMRMRGLAKDQRLEIFMEQHILQSCFNRNDPNDPPKIEEIIDFLNKNEVAVLSEEHLRFVLQEMDNTLYQELLLILLKNESESDDPDQQLRKAEILNIINTNSSLFLKKRVGSLFERYGAVETKDAELKSILEEKQKSLIELRSKLLAKISMKDLVDERKTDKFKDSLNTLVEQGIKNCKATVLFRENFDQDAETEAETEAETDAENELEADLEVSKVKQEPSRVASEHRVWICNVIDSLRQNPDQFDQVNQDIIPLSDMLQSVETVNTAYLELDSKLYISKNHVRMYTEQHDLFNDYRMPIQDVLMFRDSKGTLQALIITPNEKQELMASKKDIFKDQYPQMWIESSTGVVVYAGTRPLEVEKDLKYLKIQEQIKFMNGDMKNLLMQDKYVWLPRHLENKKTLLSTKILTNRPEQVEYTGKLLTRVKELRVKYEQVAIQLLRGASARAAVENYFTVATNEDIDKIAKISGELLNVDEILRLRAESKEDENVILSACKLIATFQDFPVDSKLLHELYPDIDEDNISCLSNAYAAKKVLLQLHATKAPSSVSKKRDKTPTFKNQFSEFLQKLKFLSSTKQDVLKKLLMEGVVCNDPELITVIFKAFPDVLNEITGPLHPVTFAMKNRDYLRLTDLLEQHFAAEKREPEGAEWIQTAFANASEKKDLKFLKILIEKSGGFNLPLALMEKVIIALSENEQDDLLKTFYEKCVLRESLEAKKLKEKYENLAKALKINLSRIRIISSSILATYGEAAEKFMDFQYVFEQPNFTVVSRGITQLMMACEEGNLTDYKQLIERGADIFQKAIPRKNVYPSYDLRASLEHDVFAYAVSGGNSEIVRDLLHRVNVIERLSLDSIKAVLLALIANDKKFGNELVNEIVQALIDRALLPEKSGELTKEFALLFSHAIKNNNFNLAKKLIQVTDAKKVSLVCSIAEILGTLKIMQANLEPLNPEFVNCFLIVLEKIPREEKIDHTKKFIDELQKDICALLKRGDTHNAKRILDTMNEPTFNVTFLDRFMQHAHYVDIQPHLALIKELSKNVSSAIIETKNLGENRPLLSDFMEILNQAPELDSTENLENISVINEIISTLVNGKDTLEIFRFKSKWSSRMQHSQPLLLLLLKHAARNSHNQKCILDLLNKNYPGNLEFDYTVYVEKDRRDKNINENLLLWAIKNNFKALVDLLLENGASLSDVIPKCGKSGFALLCGTPAYIDKLTSLQLELLENVLEKENFVETLEIDKYLSYLQEAISKNREQHGTFDKPIEHLDMGFVSQLMRYAEDYAKKLPETVAQDSFRTFIQTTVNAISSKNDILEVCNVFSEHPVFKQYFSDQLFVKIKDNLLNAAQYTNALQGQKNFELLRKILEKTPVEQNDFSKFVECCLRCPPLEQKSDDNFQSQIFDVFIQKISVDQLLSMSDETMERFSKLPDDLFEKIIDASIAQSKNASKEEQAIIRLKMLNMLNFVVKRGSDHKIKNFLSKASDILRLDKEQKENVLFNLVEYNGECKLDNILDEIVEMLDVRSVLADESKKGTLVKLSIKNHNNALFNNPYVFLNYLLSKGYVDKVSPEIIDAMIEKHPRADVSAITKFLKKSIGVEALLTAMCVKHTAQVQAQKQQEMRSFGSPAKPATILSQFINYQLVNINGRVGEPIFQQLAEKIGLKMIEETIKTGLSVESAKKNKNKPFIQQQVIPLQISDTKKVEGEQILQEFERKKGLRVIGEAMEEIITNYRIYATAKNVLLEIIKFPTLCESILEYYDVKNFSELSGKPIYNSLTRNFEVKALEEFGGQFDQAVTNVRQNRRPQV